MGIQQNNIICEVLKSLYGFINRIKMREKKSSEVKDKPIDYISSEEEQEIKLKESKQSFRDLWDSK